MLKFVKKIIACCIAAFILVVAVRFVLSVNVINDLCDNSVGKSYSDLQLIAEQKNILISRVQADGEFIIHSPHNAGRMVCVMRLGDDDLVSWSSFKVE